ncbi:cell wall-active antibiotics response protein [Paenibacillus sp. 481]|nr:cell wall-active antibiotics response protein [Paenibacillus sp. 481]
MKSNNRILAYVLIIVGLLILIGKWLAFETFLALVFLFFGVRKIRAEEIRTGYILVGIGGALLMIMHLPLIIGIVLISLGIFYMRSRKVRFHERVEKRQNLSTTLKWDREPYVLRSMSMWHFFGESNIDLSLAIFEEKETTLLFQGIIGDMNITIPDDVGVEIEATVLLGSIDMLRDKETGFYNKWTWHSPNYDCSEQRVKLRISYILGDIDIRLH